MSGCIISSKYVHSVMGMNSPLGMDSPQGNRFTTGDGIVLTRNRLKLIETNRKRIVNVHIA